MILKLDYKDVMGKLVILYLLSIYHSCINLSQLSGKSDKEQQEREAAIVKAAREDASPISKSFSSKPKKFDDDDNESVLFTKPLGKSNSKVKDDLSDTDESEISDVSLDESVIVAPPRPKFVPPAAVERAQPIKPKVPVPETPVCFSLLCSQLTLNYITISIGCCK